LTPIRPVAHRVLSLALFACVLTAQDLPRAGVKEPSAGEILIATPKSHDPVLAHSVVLLIHCDRDGAMGLIVNRPNGKAYEGGPIDLGVRTLFRSRSKPEGAEQIAGDIFMLPGISKAGRVFVGYTGWSTQQLKDELELGLWKIHAPDANLVFDPNPSTLWTRLLR
jgi:putative transcriptional regulator